jgi:hypothetical protein
VQRKCAKGLDVCCVVEIDTKMTFFDYRYRLQQVHKRRERGREKKTLSQQRKTMQ